MHVVKKTIKGKTYLYMYKTVREGDKVKKKYVSYIGPEGKILS